MNKTTNEETFIRGGRLRKTSRGLISFAPFLAGASALALGALLSTTSPVEAGTCATAGQPAGTARCADPANSMDRTVSLTASTTGPFTVTDAPGFGLDVPMANSKGIAITSALTTGLITVDLDGNIKATANTLEILQSSTSHGVAVTLDGTVTSTGGDGVYASAAVGQNSITVNGAVMAQTEGISFNKTSDMGSISITTGENGDITSTAEEGIDVRTLGGDVTFNINGDITSTKQAILLGNNGGSGNAGGMISVTTGANSVLRSTANNAIDLGTTQARSTDVVLNLAGDIGTSSNANYYHGVRFTHAGTGDVTATLDGDIFVASGSRGLSIVTNPSADEATITVNGNINVASGTSNSHGRGISLRHGGGGAADVTVATGATITSSGTGILANANNGLKVTVDGTVDANGGNGISSTILGNSLNIYVNGMVSGSTGVFLDNRGTSGGEAILHVSGTITGDGGTAITTSGAGVSRIIIMDGATINGLINTSAATGGTSIEFDASATSVGALSFTGATTLDIGGRTVGSTSGAALTLSGAGDKAITLGTGGSITGTIDASGATGAVNLDISGAVTPTGGNAISLGGASNHIVTLREGANIDGRIEKVSGATGNVEFRIEGDVTANPVSWKNNSTQASANSLHNFGAGDSITIADGARFQFGEGTILNAIPVNLHGRLVFSGVSDNTQVTLANFRGMGGEIEMDINFAGGDRERTVPRFALNNLDNSNMEVRVNVRAFGGLPQFSENEEGEIVIEGEGDGTLDTDGDGSITIGNVIRTFALGSLGKDHFVAGEWLDNGMDYGNWRLSLVCVGCDDPLATPTWSVVATATLDAGTGGPGVPAGPATLFDTLPAVLAHLGQPESMHARTRNRSFQADTGVWGRIQTGNLSVEPSAASFETGIRNVTFGVQTPLRAERMGFTEPVTLDANITIQTADTEALIMGETQEIETNALIAGFAATWERDELYVDGQFQYARFDNNLDAADGTKLASPTADSFSAGLEVGLVFEAGDLRLGKWLDRGVLSNILITPSAQVSWSQVGFSDFIASDGRSISLDDGSVANGRLGTVVEALWERVVFHDFLAPASVRLQTNADVIVPLDGKVVTQVDGVNQPSELEDLVLDTGVGVFYTWEREDHTYTISADVSSRQGSEVEDYKGSLGFKYRF